MHSVIFPSQRFDSDHDFDLNTCITSGELGSRLVSTEYPRGAQLCLEGEPAAGIFSVRAGQAKEYCTSSTGRAAIIRIVQCGDVIGVDAVLGDRTYQSTVEAIEPVTAYFITTRDLLSSMRSDEGVRAALLRQLSDRCKVAYQEIRQFGSAVPARVARFLLDQYRTTRKWDRESGGGKILNRVGSQQMPHATAARRTATNLRINLTREEIAQSVGTSRETVSRVVTFLQRKGWILIHGNHWEIRNGHQLAALAMQQRRCATEDLSLYAA